MATEYFDVLDENGQKTGRIKPRANVHCDGDWHAAVNIFVVNQNGEVLQQRRAANKDSYPNMWDLSCGGHLSAGEDYETAALRELEEELGLKVSTSDLIPLGIFKSQTQPAPDFINNSIEQVYLVYTDKTPADFHIQEEELSAIRYIPWQKLREMLQNPESSDMLRHQKQHDALFQYLEEH